MREDEVRDRAASSRHEPAATFWVDLAGVGSGPAVPDSVASALGVRESPLHPAAEQIAAHLNASHVLVVLDNCEHVVEAAASLVEELLRRCADCAFWPRRASRSACPANRPIVSRRFRRPTST